MTPEHVVVFGQRSQISRKVTAALEAKGVSVNSLPGGELWKWRTQVVGRQVNHVYVLGWPTQLRDKDSQASYASQVTALYNYCRGQGIRVTFLSTTSAAQPLNNYSSAKRSVEDSMLAGDLGKVVRAGLLWSHGPLFGALERIATQIFRLRLLCLHVSPPPVYYSTNLEAITAVLSDDEWKEGLRVSVDDGQVSLQEIAHQLLAGQGSTFHLPIPANMLQFPANAFSKFNKTNPLMDQILSLTGGGDRTDPEETMSTGYSSSDFLKFLRSKGLEASE